MDSMDDNVLASDRTILGADVARVETGTPLYVVPQPILTGRLEQIVARPAVKLILAATGDEEIRPGTGPDPILSIGCP
jgi:hypothetical protein